VTELIAALVPIHSMLAFVADMYCLFVSPVGDNLLLVLCVVYNWTVDNVVSWLSEHVELSQYASNFKANAVEGRALPRYTQIVLILTLVT